MEPKFQKPAFLDFLHQVDAAVVADINYSVVVIRGPQVEWTLRDAEECLNLVIDGLHDVPYDSGSDDGDDCDEDEGEEDDVIDGFHDGLFDSGSDDGDDSDEADSSCAISPQSLSRWQQDLQHATRALELLVIFRQQHRVIFRQSTWPVVRSPRRSQPRSRMGIPLSMRRQSSKTMSSC